MTSYAAPVIFISSCFLILASCHATKSELTLSGFEFDTFGQSGLKEDKDQDGDNKDHNQHWDAAKLVAHSNSKHVSQAIDNLMHIDDIEFKSDLVEIPRTDNKVKINHQDEDVKFTTISDSALLSADESVNIESSSSLLTNHMLISSSSNLGANIEIMNGTLRTMLSKPRSDAYSKRSKDNSRSDIISRFEEYKLQVLSLPFMARKRGNQYKGQNIVAIIPGKNRNVLSKDEIMIVGAHYDTVETSPGIDDNGSGIIALFEIARILSSMPQLNHTVMLAAFDLEELGLLGSLAFVREYLIPTELIKNKAKFLGAIVIDMALNYDNSPGSQSLPRDIATATPGIARQISLDGSRGDFLAVWARKDVDTSLYESLAAEWKKSSRSSNLPRSGARSGRTSSANYKLRAFEPSLPETAPSVSELYKFGTFTRSDHASFWYHKHPTYKSSLAAILLTDMGPWRGSNKKCYHSWCDDVTQVTESNLNFLKNTIDNVVNVLTRSSPQITILSKPSEPEPAVTQAEGRSFFVPTKSPNPGFVFNSDWPKNWPTMAPRSFVTKSPFAPRPNWW